MQIIRGKVPTAIKVVIYGVEGIGKSTFAAGAPDALFIDVEDSTVHMDVARLPKPQHWHMLIQQIQWVAAHKPCKSLVIDSADWVEQMCKDHVLQKNNWQSIEDPGYGKGFVAMAEEYARFINALTGVIDVGINVILTAHATIRKFEEPDQMGAYDRYEMKLDKRVGPMVKEWTDVLLFANYKNIIVTDSKTKSKKAQGGHRVMHTTHNPAWDAKNRMSLPEELDLSMDEIMHIFPAAEEPKPEPEPVKKEAPQPQPELEPEPEKVEEKAIDERLIGLLAGTGFSIGDLERALGPQGSQGLGYMPPGTKAIDYPTEFVDFVSASWDTVLDHMTNTALPFEL